MQTPTRPQQIGLLILLTVVALVVLARLVGVM